MVKLTNIVSKIRGFLKETHLETKKVVWPNRQHVVMATVVIFIIVILVGVFVMGLDLAFSKAYTYLATLIHK